MLDRLSATASIAVRHAGAYADLIASDLSLSSRDVRRQLVAAATLGFGILLATALACVLAIAAAWDTPARLWVICALIGAALLVVLVAALRLRRVKADAVPLLGQTAQEWDKDRRLLEELLERPQAGDA
jgi:uncharacterized membrane protein YqjE